ncbi:hypothetical protein GH721_16325 [Kriegella sp. EG-1]|nr:hypothetical protein [Flavobacteriaceae bacterium EG-1]
MKIVFICGSLEPGKDGVGDYTRRLASELIKQNHEVSVIALNDSFISANNSSSQFFENIKIDTLRLASTLNVKSREILAKNWIQKKDPEFLSLQFVPFSYHPKGIPFGLTKLLLTIGAERKWHIMFHEIWLGMNIESSTKHKIIGKIQQGIIKTIFKKLQPKIVHTHSQLYKCLLENIGISASILPLYSNIPVCELNNEKNMNDAIQFVVFGGIAPSSNFEQFAIEVANLSKKQNKNICLTFVGRNGPHQKQWVEIWKKLNLEYNILGELSPKEISYTLKTMNIAITTTPYALIEKSGAAAAMACHNIPVISISNSWSTNMPYKINTTSGFFEYKKGQLGMFISNSSNIKINSFSAQEVAQKMVLELVQ